MGTNEDSMYAAVAAFLCSAVPIQVQCQSGEILTYPSQSGEILPRAVRVDMNSAELHMFGLYVVWCG